MAQFGPMNRAVGFIAAALLAGSGCGDNFGPPPMTPAELMDRLRALPGVTVQQADGAPENYSYYILHFTQPLDQGLTQLCLTLDGGTQGKSEADKCVFVAYMP